MYAVFGMPDFMASKIILLLRLEGTLTLLHTGLIKRHTPRQQRARTIFTRHLHWLLTGSRLEAKKLHSPACIGALRTPTRHSRLHRSRTATYGTPGGAYASPA